MRINVTINGGPINVWHRYGLKCNPFPQLARYEYSVANRMLQELDSDPIESTDRIRTILSGCAPEFIEICCAEFKAGQRVSFHVAWPG